MTEELANFNAFFDKFKKHDWWKAMQRTRENSPWHREKSVAVHTQMLIDWYLDNLFSKRSPSQRVLTLVACLFHDVGKPPSEIIKHSEERGEYRAYHGHEQVSARMWIDYASSHQEDVAYLLRFDSMTVSNIALMLEHHVPFQIAKKDKRTNLKKVFFTRMGESGHRAWLDLLLSDQHGRISDGQAEKLAAVDQWMQNWEMIEV